MRGIINRLEENSVETLGAFYFYDGTDELFKCVSLELADKQNQRSVSRIPAGEYVCKKRWSKKYNWHYEVENVDCRELILLHWGNFYIDTEGCIIFGKSFVDINNDGFKDVTNSKDTISKFMKIAPEWWKLTINNI